MYECDLCGRKEYESSARQQLSYWLCASCVNYNTDEELTEKMENKDG